MSIENPDIITLPMMRDVLYTAVVCDALDQLGHRDQSPRLQLQSMTGVDRLVGRCKTTLWSDLAHEDPHPYLPELEAVDGCQPDEVFIAAGAGSMRAAIWGELLSTAARNAGCVGAIIDGAVRDVAVITSMAFPVFALGTSPYDTLHRQRVTDVDVSIEIGGTRIDPGDLIFADRDGVVVVPQVVEDEAIRRAWQKAHAENTTRQAIQSGMKAADAYKRFGVI